MAINIYKLFSLRQLGQLQACYLIIHNLPRSAFQHDIPLLVKIVCNTFFGNKKEIYFPEEINGFMLGVTGLVIYFL